MTAGDFAGRLARDLTDDYTIVFPLDSISASPKLAVWTTLLRAAHAAGAYTAYNGSASHDIGFLVDGSLDAAALGSFGGASNAVATRWYDQSGHGHDLATPVAGVGPKIYDGASHEVVSERSHPVLQFAEGTASPLSRSDALGLAADPALTIAFCADPGTSTLSDAPVVFSCGTSGNDELNIYFGTGATGYTLFVTDFAANLGVQWALGVPNFPGLHSFIFTKPAGGGYDPATWLMSFDGSPFRWGCQIANGSVGQLALGSTETIVGQVAGAENLGGNLLGLLLWDSVLNGADMNVLQRFLVGQT